MKIIIKHINNYLEYGTEGKYWEECICLHNKITYKILIIWIIIINQKD